MSLYWLSFARDIGFIGAAIVQADSMRDAHAEATRLGCNPGGQIAGVHILADIAPRIPREYIGRLMSREECEKLDGMMGGDGPANRGDVADGIHSGVIQLVEEA
jgi:hypothetical protein